MNAPGWRGYYAIVDVKDATEAYPAALLVRARALLAAGPCCLQLRAKRLPAAAMRAAAAALLPACRQARVALCVNDRLDVALAVHADVIHVGQDDLPLAEVRRLLRAAGSDMRVGVSTHSFDQALAAAAGGADYIGFGPVFATATKHAPDPVVGIEGLGRVCAGVAVPVVAIGGVTRANLAAVVAAGAAAAAVISDIDRAFDRSAAAGAVARAFA